MTPLDANDTVVYRVTVHATEESETFALATGDMSAVDLATLI